MTNPLYERVFEVQYGRSAVKQLAENLLQPLFYSLQFALFGVLYAFLHTTRQPHMKRAFLIFTTAFLINTSYAAETLPKDVQTFRDLADQCEHFAGEQDADLDEQRQKELDAKLEATCGKAAGQLKTLRAKYKNDAALMKVINAYDF